MVKSATSDSTQPSSGAASALGTLGNVTRVGNSYSGNDVAGDITINGKAPSGSVTSLPAGAMPSGIGSGFSNFAGGDVPASAESAANNLDARSRLESMGRLMASGQIQAPQAGPSFIASGNTGFRRARSILAGELGAQRQFDYAQGNDPASRARNAQLLQTTMQEQGANARAMLGDLGSTRRTQMEQGGALQRTSMQELGHLQRQQIASRATVDAANARSQAPAGYRYTADGSLTHIPGGPADPTVRGSRAPLNDTQAKALQFGTRMQEAGKKLDELAKDGPDGKAGVEQPGLIKRAAGDGALGSMLNWTQSAEQQQVEQSQRDFINAVLRRESGAAIADAEFNNARKQYFPQVGDTPEVIEQKRQNQRIATAGIMAEVPDAEKRVGQVLGAAQTSASPTQGQSAAQPKSERSVARTGTMNGRRVIQYSDGSVEYAN
ncbi:hypothetical protein [Diaphorobacter caeni]|uniref:hypothetical protein n=1 Tax=Diaphorobacter caeni TaxID=2784387 RepID=UPI00188F17D3|nr:hypothetical protein [Diaphorobacter caeni]MBF5006851.1 hypothetical protein [Diaphorobacter caeni]